jgi:nitrite reductase (NADH) large subunit
MPDTQEICGCNGVCKGSIVSAITTQGLTTLDDVKAVTKASASCGSCTPLVEQVLKLTLGDGFKEQTGPKPMCKCTAQAALGRPQGHRRLRAEVHARRHAGHGMDHARRLLVVPAGPELLPAVRLAVRISRRQAVALHQRAGPRQHPEGRHLFGRAAHVGRHDHPRRAAGHRRRRRQVRHPGGQGHRRPAHRPAGRQEGRPAGRLGRPQRRRHGQRPRLRQGPAHGEDLRRQRLVPVRHPGLHRPGHPLEKFLWGSWAPAKVKLAVSGCPRNCAEATCKDFGVVCVDSGYEIHIGGAAGLHIQGTRC